MDLETIVIGCTCAAAGAVAKFFFDRWNRVADQRERTGEEGGDDGSFVTQRECRHHRKNYESNTALQNQLLSMQVEKMSCQLDAIKAILLKAASHSGIPIEELTELTK